MASRQRAPQNSGAGTSASFALSVCPNRICPEEVTRSGTLGLAFLTVSRPAARVRNECAVRLLRITTPKRAKTTGLNWPPCLPILQPSQETRELPPHCHGPETFPISLGDSRERLALPRFEEQGHTSWNTKQPPEDRCS